VLAALVVRLVSVIGTLLAASSVDQCVFPHALPIIVAGQDAVAISSTGFRLAFDVDKRAINALPYRSLQQAIELLAHHKDMVLLKAK
jgi:hypothetical protein